MQSLRKSCIQQKLKAKYSTMTVFGHPWLVNWDYPMPDCLV